MAEVVKAIDSETLSKIKELIESEGEIFFNSSFAYKALNRALETGRKEVAKFLLADSDCRVNKSIDDLKNFNTPLHNAIKLGDIEIVDLLLKNDASVLATNSDDNSPLHMAFLHRYEGIVDRLLMHLEETSSYENIKNKDDLTHFHIACTRKNKNVIAGFIEAKANITDVFRQDSPSSWAGYTALHFAIEFKSTEAVTILSKVISDDKSLTFNTKVSSSSGKTPLQLVHEYLENLMITADCLDIVKDEKKHMSYFHLACLKENVSVVKKFIKNGADVNSRIGSRASHGYFNYSPLHCALDSRKDRTEKVQVLLKNGAKIQRNYEKDDMTPLHLSLYTEYSEDHGKTADLLYEALEDKKDNITDVNGFSIFHIAVTRNDFETVGYHLDNGVDINKVVMRNSHNYSNYTALHFAMYFDHLDMVKFLIERGADVNANFGKSNDTPLFLALDCNNFEYFELLLKHGARVDIIRQRDKQTLLHSIVELYISSNEDEQVKILKHIEMLVLMGVDVNAIDADGYTALHTLWWAQEKCAACVKLLLDLGADVNVEAPELGLAFRVFKGTDFSTEECKVFFEHVNKLKTLNFYVCPGNMKSYEMILESMDEDELIDMDRNLNEEIVILKNTKITSYLSLYEFLMLDTKCAAAYVKNEASKKIIEDVAASGKLLAYGYLIKSLYRKALKQI